MPHPLPIGLLGILVSVPYLTIRFAKAQQTSNEFEKQPIFVPLIDAKKPIDADVSKLEVKTGPIQFIKHTSGSYLKVSFSVEKDTVTDAPVLKKKSELEIKSGTKVYYKKEWAIYQEKNHLFFVLALPSHYLKTLASKGITEILIDTRTVISLSKKETQQIKDRAAHLLSMQQL
mgnify:CR=1 FL=1